MNEHGRAKLLEKVRSFPGWKFPLNAYAMHKKHVAVVIVNYDKGSCPNKIKNMPPVT